MKKLIAIFLLIFSSISYCQVTINPTQNPNWLAQNALVQSGVTPFNVTFNGIPQTETSPLMDQASQFLVNLNPTNLGILGQGLLLTTGNSSAALGPNNSGSSSFVTSSPIMGDPDLTQLLNNSSTLVKNTSILEFDFVATDLILNFYFVFGSEEYPEWVNSPYNDVFGFFLSGPGIAGPYSNGAKNIALVPDTTIPISIGTVNNGLNNNGICANCDYYYNNSTIGQNPNLFPLLETIQYDGFTSPILATSQLQYGQVYHIKLAVANVSDNAFDSGVFIKSFNILPLTLVDNNGLTSNPDVCYGETITLSSNIGLGINNFVWTKDGMIIPGQNSPTLSVTQSGLYAIYVYSATNTFLGTDDILIGCRPEILVSNPVSLTSCATNTFNINQTNAVLGTLNPNDYFITYYNSTYQDALYGTNNGLIPDSDLSAYSVNSPYETIWIRVEEIAFGCVVVKPFTLNVNPAPFGGIAYSASVYPVTETNPQSNISGVTLGGFYSSFPEGLSLDPISGIFIPSTSLPNNYTVTYTISSNGACPSVIFSTVVVIATIPEVSVNNVSVCLGSVATITATPNQAGNYFYEWTVPSGAANPGNIESFYTYVSGFYSVSITDLNSGFVSSSATGEVIINETAPPTGVSPQVFDTMTDIYLSDIVVSGTDVVWFASFDNAISNTNPLAQTTVLESGMTYYAVRMIDGCISSTPLAIVVTINLANTNFDLVGLEYYLNPMFDILNISYTQKIDSVRIYNIIGQQIKSIKPNASALQIDLSTYSFGTYILKIESGSKSKVIKVIRN